MTDNRIQAAPLCRIRGQHHGADVDESNVVAQVGTINVPVLSTANSAVQFINIPADKGQLQGCQFVEDNAQWPDVALVVIRIVVKQLRGHVQWCAIGHGRVVVRAGEDLRDSEIGDFHPVIPVQENVFRLQIPVDDIPDVQVIDAHQEVAEESQDLLFIEVDLFLATQIDELAQGSVRRVLHEDINDSRSEFEDPQEADDPWMVQFGENVNLLHHFRHFDIVRVQVDGLHDDLSLSCGVIIQVHFSGKRNGPDRVWLQTEDLIHWLTQKLLSRCTWRIGSYWSRS